MHEAVSEIQIPFADVDAMNVTWHGHYVKYFDIARSDLFDTIDYNYFAMNASGYHWPVIDVRVRYPRPSVFGQVICVTSRIVEWDNRLKISYEIHDKTTQQRLTRGYTCQVAVEIASGEMCYESPDILLQKLGVQR